MFTDTFRESTLSERLRGLAVLPGAAFLLCQVYFSLIGLLTAVPRWLFESVRILLLAGAAAGLVGTVVLVWRHRAGWSWGAAAWLGVVVAASLLCAWILAGMSVPFLV